MDLAAITDLVGGIYDAPGDPHAWDRLTVRLAEAFRSEFSQMIVFSRPDDLLYNFVNVRAAGEEWARDYASLDTAVQRVGRLTRGAPVTQFDLMTDDELKHCPVQQEFLPKHRVEHRIWIKARPRTDLTQLAALIRSTRQGAFTENEYRSFDILRWHLQRAMGLHVELAEARRRAATLELGLDRLQSGVILLDSSGAALFANRAARAVLDAGDGLRLDREGLKASIPHANPGLQSLIARALGRSGLAVGGGIAVERPDARPLIVRAVPLNLPDKDGLPPAAAVAVFLSDPDRLPEADHAALSAMNLTPAECRLVAALLAGRTLEQYAARAQLSLHTVRSVLKSVFDKTGTHRQSELIILALQNSVAHASGE